MPVFAAMDRTPVIAALESGVLTLMLNRPQRLNAMSPGLIEAMNHELGRARALAMLGSSVPAEEAQRMGMVWQVLDDAALMEEAKKLAHRLAAGPTLSYAAIKQAINVAATNTLDQQLDLERDSQRALGRSADYKEGVAAFLAKRPAIFSGR